MNGMHKYLPPPSFSDGLYYAKTNPIKGIKKLKKHIKLEYF
jgi:hypothetical protein